MPNRGPRGILCTSGEKEYAGISQPTAACDNRLVKREAYDASPGMAPYKSDDTMFLPVGKSDAPRARGVPLARYGLKIVIVKHFLL